MLFELGNAEHEIGDPAAYGHLRAAGETTTDPLLRAQAFMALAWTTHPEPVDSASSCRSTSGRRGGGRPRSRTALQLEAARLGALLFNPDLPVRYEPEADRFTDDPH